MSDFYEILYTVVYVYRQYNTAINFNFTKLMLYKYSKDYINFYSIYLVFSFIISVISDG